VYIYILKSPFALDILTQSYLQNSFCWKVNTFVLPLFTLDLFELNTCLLSYHCTLCIIFYYYGPESSYWLTLWFLNETSLYMSRDVLFNCKI